MATYFVDGQIIELKTANMPISGTYLKDVIRSAVRQIENSPDASTGAAEIQLIEEASAATFKQIEDQVCG